MPLETVQKKCCNNCLFTKNKIVSDAAKDEILEDCVTNNKKFLCHKGTIRGVDIVCRGYYEKYNDPAVNKLLESVGEIEFVEID
ncbi:hypothetical protein L1267_22210 [Pseudoalteromonas sp. OFAV1]|jgi:hypothetical protein|uniref:hypothetical protein n=1 Tax=Pseudoalteromonas sp. OFAV1 TaxID=2908892 RepID=UPI001F3D3BF6|nr:hypothetical protein [Pseudoalteromonas sp. OFAV1]MCF2903087.1 hypothetical protein [Pseudoalteromonas sp. OFAV1]